MGFDLRFQLALLYRQLPLVLAIIVVTTNAGMILAFILPSVYRAEARLLVESPQIPDELAASTIRSSAEEFLHSIEQRLLTRDNLLKLAEEYGIFADTPDLPPDAMAEAMRSQIEITAPPFQQNNGLVTVSFGAATPEQSAAVSQALASQILEQSVELRTTASGGTLSFFEQEVKRLSGEMAVQNAKILEFEQDNRNALPESLEYRRTRQSTQQERLLQVDRELAGLRDRRQRLADLFDRTGRIGPSLGPLTPEQQQLEDLRQELASALVLFSPENPRVHALQTQVAALEEAVDEQLGGGVGDGLTSAFDVQIADIDGQIDFLAEQKALLEKELAEIEASIAATPANAIVLGQLRSDYDNLRVQYDQATQSLADARMGDRIEVTARGQRITMVENAVIPSSPAEPNRKLIVAAALGAGVVLAGALLFVLEVLNSTVRRPVELVAALDIKPFGTVPFLVNSSDTLRERKTLGIGIVAILFGLPLVLYLVYTAVIPQGHVAGFPTGQDNANTMAETVRPENLE